MIIDHETQSAIDTLIAAGFSVHIDQDAAGFWAVEASDPATGESTKVEADDSLAATVELARRLDVPVI